VALVDTSTSTDATAAVEDNSGHYQCWSCRCVGDNMVEASRLMNACAWPLGETATMTLIRSEATWLRQH
jgi:hypothetical protein